MDESERLKLQAWLDEARSTYMFIHWESRFKLCKNTDKTDDSICKNTDTLELKKVA